MATIKVFLVESLGAPRNHHAIYVEFGPESWRIFNVTGNIQDGMDFEVRDLSHRVEDDPVFISKTEIGKVSRDKLDHLRQICEANPPPEKQFDGPKRLYKNQPLRRCQEWTAETIEQLKAEGVLE
jgi:hypothetical protein